MSDSVDYESEWLKVLTRLRAYDGVAVRDIMAGVFYRDKGAWNVLYWRTHYWLQSFLSRFPLSPSEEALDLRRWEIGSARLSEFLYRMRGKKISMTGKWDPPDLPAILHRFKEIDIKFSERIRSEASSVRPKQREVSDVPTHPQGGNRQPAPELGGNKWT